MILPTRHFLGWDAPLVGLVADWLLARGDELPRMLVVVPTAQSGRRLRQDLAERAAGGCVLAPRVCTPDAFFRADGDEVAGEAVLRAAWLECIGKMVPTDLEVLAGAGAAENVRRTEWMHGVLELLLPTMELLADAGIRPGMVPQRCRRAMLDGERWELLDKLAGCVRERLAGDGLVSADEAKRARADAPVLPPGVSRIVVAGVPDPVPLAVRAWQNILHAGRAGLEVLIGAPAGEAEKFDEWGQPQREAWAAELLPIPGGNHSIRVGRDAGDVAKLAVEACRGRASHEVALGVPDRSYAAEVVRALDAAGWRVFDPDGRTAGQTGMRVWVDAWLDAVVNADPDYAVVVRVLRNEAAWRLLGLNDSEAYRLVNALDRLQSAHLPQTMNDALKVCENWPGDAGTLLRRAFAGLPEILGDDKRALPERWLAMLERLVDAGHDDGANGRMLDAMIAATAALAQVERVFPEMDETARVGMWRRSLPKIAARDEVGESVLDLNGWIELPFDRGRHLVVIGMHDGQVPDSRRNDAMLPDSVRAELGLRDHALRFARDAYLWRMLVASRAAAGSVTVVLGKFDGMGEPKMPSPLLLRCDPDELPERVAHCFPRKSAEGGDRPAQLRGRFMLDFPYHELGIEQVAEPISPTKIRDYLACPFTFYLKYVLKLERAPVDAQEMDARLFGSLMHEVLERFGNDAGLRDSCSGKDIEEFLVEELARLAAERFPGRRGMPLIVQLAALEERLRAFAYRQALEAEQGWRIRKVEWAIGGNGRPAWSLNGTAVRMTIDRVDFHEEQRLWRVLDYKSGKVKSVVDEHLESHREGKPQLGELIPPAGKQKSARRWKNVQLPVYAAALRDLGAEHLGMRDGDRIGVAYFHLPRATSDTKLLPWDGYENGAEHKVAMDWAGEAVDRIKAGVFWPPVVDANRLPQRDWRALAPDGWDAALSPECVARFETMGGQP